MFLMVLSAMMTSEVDPALLSLIPSPDTFSIVQFSILTLLTFFRKMPSPLTPLW